jgi:spermidine synthase
MTRIFLVYALSGFLSLAYQVAWFRIFTDWFGSTNLTFALVVINFIGGLAVGALLSRRLTNIVVGRTSLRDRLRIYGLVELLIGATVLMTVLATYIPADLLGPFPYHLIDGIWVQTTAYRLTQAATAAACVFIPCVFMGVTFPLLCDVFNAAPRGKKFPAALYAWNTLGACTGVLTCQFLLLPWLGHDMTLQLMAGLNLLLGAYFLAAGNETKFGALAAPVRERAKDSIAPAESVPAGPAAVLLVLAALSGFLSGALEGDLFKRISFAIMVNPGATMSFISFWAILAIFVASSLVHRWARLTLAPIKIMFVVALLYFMVSTYFIDAITEFLSGGLVAFMLGLPTNRELDAFLTFPSNLLQLLLFVGILVFPPYFLISALLPYVCNHLQAQGRHIGAAYGLNTIAFCIGLASFTLVAPKVNIFYSLKLFTLLFAIVVVSLALLREDRRITRWRPAMLLAVAGIAITLTSTDFDPRFFTADSPPRTYPVRALKSNAANTTFVVDEGEHAALFFGRLRMSATNIRAQTYMRLMAHFPLLLHPNPESALLVCFGAGNTASAIAAHDSLRRIDIVDLNEKVFETAPEFATTNNEVYLDPRVRLIHDDGRNFLNVTDQTYDLITSEPPPPLAAGVYRLYSREYYEAALNHLTSDGLMTQWLPLYLMNPEVIDLAISTFLDVFPHTLIFTGYASDFILIGSPAPIELGRIEARYFESATVIEDLKRAKVDRPENLLARIVNTDQELRDRFAEKRTISDQHNDLEGFFRDGDRPAIIGYNPKRVLDFIRTAGPYQYGNIEPVLTHLGRLRYHVRDFPFASLATVRFSESADVALGEADWISIAKLNDTLREELGAENIPAAIAILEQLLAIEEEQPTALRMLAELRLRNGQFERAMAPLRLFQSLEPTEAIGYHLLGRALMLTGRSDEALEQFRQSVERQPDAYMSLARMAWILATHPDPGLLNPAEAIRLAQTAVELSNRQDPFVLQTLAAAYAADGQFDRATTIARSAVNAIVDDADSNLPYLRIQLQAYRNSQSLSDGSLIQRP